MRAFEITYDETLYAPLDVSLIKILLSCKNIGNPSVDDESKKVRLNAKKPNRACNASLALLFDMLTKIVSRIKPESMA